MRSLFTQGSTTRLLIGKLRLHKLVLPHWLAMTLQLSVLALVIGGITASSVMGWRFRSVHANQVWLDQCSAEYEWHYQVPHVQRPLWQRVQRDIANAMGPACVSDFHTIKLTGQLPDQSLSRLNKLKHVEQLTVESDIATDRVLENVSQLRQLRNLTLSGKQFSFEGLLELRKLPNLRNLVLRDMSLSMAELAVLESAVPQTNLKYNRSQSGRTYERQVATRYPRIEKKQEPTPSGFAPLLGQAPNKESQQPAS